MFRHSLVIAATVYALLEHVETAIKRKPEKPPARVVNRCIAVSQSSPSNPLLPHHSPSPVDGPGHHRAQTVILFSKCNPTSVNMCMSDRKHCSTICLRARRFALLAFSSSLFVPSTSLCLFSSASLTAFFFSRPLFSLRRRRPFESYIFFDTLVHVSMYVSIKWTMCIRRVFS